MSRQNEIYENSPLVETIFELRFPGEPKVECNRDKFYERIRDPYNNVLVPRASDGKAMATEPYKFERGDGKWGVALSINKMAVYCRAYEGFRLFKQEVMRLVSIFNELYAIRTISRTGLRYVNIIPFTREDDIIPLHNYLNVGVKLPLSKPLTFANLNLIIVSKTDGGKITTRIEPVIAPDKTQEAIILDFDYIKEGVLSLDSIDEYFEESHTHTKHLFEELITNGYKKVMRGEVI